MSLNTDLIALNKQAQTAKNSWVSEVLTPLILDYHRVELCGLNLTNMQFKVFNIWKAKSIQERIASQFPDFSIYTTSEMDSNDRYTVYFDLSTKED
jgi:hypothetical protein